MDIERMDVVRKAGIDKEGRDVYIFLPENLPEGVDLERVTMYGVWLMHESVVAQARPYTAVWVCNNVHDSRLGFSWFRRIYKMLPHAYHKQMRCVCVVHPSIQVRLLVFMLSYIVKHSFWEKLVYADRIEFLDEVLKDETISSLPRDVKEYDAALDKAMQSMMNDPALQAMGGGSMPSFRPHTGDLDAAQGAGGRRD